MKRQKIKKEKTNFIKKFIRKWKENKEMFIKAKNHQDYKIDDNVAISVQHLSKIFKIGFQKYKIAIKDLSFDVKKGQFHGFIGDNGAGKTTTIRSILGFYPNTFGKIFINGIDSKNIKFKNLIGYIPEVAIFPKKFTVREYLYSCAEMSKIPRKRIKEKIEELLNKYQFNIPELDKSPALMSSGQKKTVLLMQALLNDPEILIMDEPAANLDPSARIKFFSQIQELHKAGKTILISSHILDELEKYIDSYTVLSYGQLLDHGNIKDKIISNELNIKLELSDPSLIIEYLDKQHIKYQQEEKIIFCKLDEVEQNNLLQEIIKRKINIISFKPNKSSLNTLYFKNNSK